MAWRETGASLKSYLKFKFEQLKVRRRLGLQASSDEVFLHAVYEALLGREPDADGLAHYLSKLQEASFSRQDVIHSIQASAEYDQRMQGVSPGHALHEARVQLVQNHIPPAKRIVDLGGAAGGQPQGALLWMGYPYVPEQITIIDLPFDERLGEWVVEEPPSLVTPQGTKVEYIYQSMADMTRIGNESVDMVFSGESIEHVSEADAEKTIQEAYRILKPGGYFCLDTPNRALTKLHSPDKLIHPEHQKEYLVHELVEKVTRNGFEVLEKKSLCPMPRSLAAGRFDWWELIENANVGDVAEEGYLFFLKCRKPAP